MNDSNNLIHLPHKFFITPQWISHKGCHSTFPQEYADDNTELTVF